MTGIKFSVVLAVGIAVASAVVMADQQQAYRASDQQLKDMVGRLDSDRDAFQASLRRASNRNSPEQRQAADHLDRSLNSFQQAADLLRDRVNGRQSNTADAENVLRRASVIDDSMMRDPLDTATQQAWQSVRVDLNDLARAYGINWNWTAAPGTSYRVDDKQVQQLLNQIATKAGRFDKSLDRAFDSSRVDSRAQDAFRQSVTGFRQAVTQLSASVNGRQSSTLGTDDVLRRGAGIDNFMQRNQLSTQAEQNWLALRSDLDGLAHAYNITWNRNSYGRGQSGANFHNQLTGTYQLETNQADDAQRAAERAVRSVPSDRRQRTYQSLLDRLEAPEMIAIERNQNNVTMASTRGQRVTFEADGRDHAEGWSLGRPINTRATLNGERLVVETTGNRASDYTATFDPMVDGRSLQMTRVIDDEGLSQPVTVRSSYRRISNEPRWDLEAGGQRDPYYNGAVGTSGFGVPEGTRFVAVLDNAISTTNARQGDLYTMTTRSPSQYEGAVIQGSVSTVNQSGLTLDLRSIRLRSGTSYQFDGVIDEVRTPDGATIRIDREGAMGGNNSQTQTAVQRGAIGAALGTIIGAVAGGGKGAAIGAVIGAGAGAGTVLLDGHDRLDLQRGTEVTITSGDPRNQRPIQR
jgi:outer membrane lipoprotein SlyB